MFCVNLFVCAFFIFFSFKPNSPFICYFTKFTCKNLKLTLKQKPYQGTLTIHKVSVLIIVIFVAVVVTCCYLVISWICLSTPHPPPHPFFFFFPPLLLDSGGGNKQTSCYSIFKQCKKYQNNWHIVWLIYVVRLRTCMSVWVSWTFCDFPITFYLSFVFLTQIVVTDKSLNRVILVILNINNKKLITCVLSASFQFLTAPGA